MQRRTAVGTICALALVLLLPVVSTAAEPSVRFSAAADFGDTADTKAVLDAIGARGDDLTLAVGDLSYGNPGGEASWCDFVTASVGTTYPFQLLSGNHESDGKDGDIDAFAQCLPNRLPGMVGTYAKEWYADVPQAQPLVRFINISPGLSFPDGMWSYDAGTPRYDWTSAAIDSARTAGIPWVVVSMHKPCLTMGKYSCDPGEDLLNLLVDRRVDLVLSGHEHLYQRSKQIAHSASCPQVRADRYDAACVVDSDSTAAKGAGTVFGVVGVGGQSIRDVNLSDPEAPYFAAYSGANVNPANGSLAVTATATRLDAQFVPVSGASFTDSFSISGSSTGNQPPSATISSTCVALTCTFSGSGSSDADGVISSYSWDFGDTANGSGVSAVHAYAAAGTFTATLTVTDDQGASDTETAVVTVDPGSGLLLASDTFERVVAGSWGSGSDGSLWWPESAAGLSVADGVGTMTLTAPGDRTVAYLRDLSLREADLSMTLSTSHVASGVGVFVSPAVRRVPDVGDYRAKLRLSDTGAVQLALSMTDANGDRTLLTPYVVADGVDYSQAAALRVRVQAVGQSPTSLRAKVWPAASPEPAAWLAETSDDTPGLQADGSVGLVAFSSTTAGATPVAVSIDDLSVRSP